MKRLTSTTKIINLLAFISLLILTNACKKDKEENKPKGDLQVAVQCQTIPEITKGAEIYSDPPGITGTTDATGTILIRDIPTGTYQLYSYITGYGGGKTAVSISEGQLSNSLIILIPDYDPGIAPIIESFYPNTESNFSPTDSIPFSIKVKDMQTPLQNLKVKVTSNHDGILFDGNADASGYVNFRKTVSQNIHDVTVAVTDESNYTAHYTSKVNATLPPGIILNVPVIVNHSVTLSWTKASADNFLKYEVYCQVNYHEPYLLEEINDINSTSFTHINVPVSPEVMYFVMVYTTQGTTATSNTQIVSSLYGYMIEEDVYDAVIDAEQHFIYVQGQTKVYKIDYLTNTLLAICDSPVDMVRKKGWGDDVVSMSLADNGAGKELYLSYYPGYTAEPEYKSVAIYNATNLHLKKNLQFVDTYGIVSSCTNGNGFLFVSHTTGYTHKLYSVDRSTYALIDSLDIEGFSYTVKNIPTKNELVLLGKYNFYHIYYNSLGKFTNEVDQPTGSYFDFWDLKPFVMSPDGSYFLVTGDGRMYTTDSELTYQNKVLNNEYDRASDDICISVSNDIYSRTYNSELYKYNYPGLNQVEDLTQDHYRVKFVKHDGNQLVVICSAWGEDSNFVMTLPD